MESKSPSTPHTTRLQSKKHRSTAHRTSYVDHLLAISQRGEWEAWLRFFLQGVRTQAGEAHRRANLLVDLREEYQER